MALNSNSATNQPKTRDEYVAEALETKRKVLDNEISIFQAIKDQEFRAFEAYLRRKPGHPTAADAEAHIDNLGLRHKIKRPKSKNVSQIGVARPRQRTEESVMRNGHAGYSGEGTLGSVEEADGMSIEALRGSDTAGPDWDEIAVRTEMAQRKRVRNQEREREREFQGVITPSYLPLLGGRRELERKENENPNLLSNQLQRKEKIRKAETADGQHKDEIWKDATGREQMNLEIAHARQTAPIAPGLSSSAENPPPTLTSPPTTPSRPISSSVPPENGSALDHRRSSSQSNLSIDGLRSSLKDPSQPTPKSPKRVQFSIDNTVVSPSTSPIARRAGAGVGDKKKMGGSEGFEVVKGKRDGNSSPNGPASDDEGGTGISSFSAGGPTTKLNGSIGGMASFGSYFHSTRAANNNNDSAAEDFDILDNEEDVFSFEEDVLARREGKQQREREGMEGEIEEDVDVDMDEDGKGNGSGSGLTEMGTSPHAGSLPIEIRMPARKGGGMEEG